MLKRVLKTPHRCVDFLRFSGDPAALSFLEAYDAVPEGDRIRIPIEAVCVKAQVSPATLLGVIMLAMRETNARESVMLTMAAHPDVVRTTIKYAKTPGGDKDRRILHEASGYLPSKGGNSISVNLLGGQPQYSAPQPGESDNDADDDEESSFTEAFPSIQGNLDEWSDNRRNLLSSGKKD